MQRRRRVLIATICAFTVVLAVATLLLQGNRPTSPSDLKSKYDQCIKVGMTRDEVELLLGTNKGEWLSKKEGGAEDRELHWGADDGVAALTFEDGKVAFKRWDQRQPPKSTFRRWLGFVMFWD